MFIFDKFWIITFLRLYAILKYDLQISIADFRRLACLDPSKKKIVTKTSRNVAPADQNEFIRGTITKRERAASPLIIFRVTVSGAGRGGEFRWYGDVICIDRREGGRTPGNAGAHKREARMNRLRRVHGTNGDIKSLLPPGTRRYRYPGARPTWPYNAAPSSSLCARVYEFLARISHAHTYTPLATRP